MAESPSRAFPAGAREAGPVTIDSIVTRSKDAQTSFVTLRSIFIGVCAELTLGASEAILANARPVPIEAVGALPIPRARIQEASWTLDAVGPVEAFAALWYLHSGITVSGTAILQAPDSASVDTFVCEERHGLGVGRTLAPVHQGTAHTSAQFHLSLRLVTSVGQNWGDGRGNEDSGERVNPAVFGSHLRFFHCHTIGQNLSLEGSNDAAHLSTPREYQPPRGRSEQWQPLKRGFHLTELFPEWERAFRRAWLAGNLLSEFLTDFRQGYPCRSGPRVQAGEEV